MNEEQLKELAEKLTEEQRTEYDAFENNEQRHEFFVRMNMIPGENQSDQDDEGGEEIPGDPDPKPKPYKSFASKEEHKEYMDKKSKSFKAKIESLSKENEDLKAQLAQFKKQKTEQRYKTKVVFVKNKVNKENKSNPSTKDTSNSLG